MSGTGRVSIPLLDAGVPLTCVDYSWAMLAVLKQKIASRRRPDRIVLADIRKLPFDGCFGLALLPFHSFAELVTKEDRASAFSAVHRALARKGRFICTLHNPAVRLRTIDGKERTLGRMARPAGPGEIAFRTRLRFDPASRTVTGIQIFDEYDGDGALQERRTMEMRFALPERREFEAMAKSAGFTILFLHGDYQGSGYQEEQSPYMIWMLQR
jgi:SAM-dependent methyltransferase